VRSTKEISRRRERKRKKMNVYNGRSFFLWTFMFFSLFVEISFVEEKENILLSLSLFSTNQEREKS